MGVGYEAFWQENQGLLKGQETGCAGPAVVISLDYGLKIVKIIFSELVGYDIKKLKSEADQCSFHSVPDTVFAMPFRNRVHLIAG